MAWTDLQVNYKHPQLKFSGSGDSMELDIFIPSWNLAIEYKHINHKHHHEHNTIPSSFTSTQSFSLPHNTNAFFAVQIPRPTTLRERQRSSFALQPLVRANTTPQRRAEKNGMQGCWHHSVGDTVHVERIYWSAGCCYNGCQARYPYWWCVVFNFDGSPMTIAWCGWYCVIVSRSSVVTKEIEVVSLTLQQTYVWWLARKRRWWWRMMQTPLIITSERLWCQQSAISGYPQCSRPSLFVATSALYITTRIWFDAVFLFCVL